MTRHLLSAEQVEARAKQGCKIQTSITLGSGFCKIVQNDNDDTRIKLIRVTITDLCDEFRRPILMLGFAKSKEQGMRVKGAVFLIFSLKGAVVRQSCFFIFD